MGLSFLHLEERAEFAVNRVSLVAEFADALCVEFHDVLWEWGHLTYTQTGGGVTVTVN